MNLSHLTSTNLELNSNRCYYLNFLHRRKLRRPLVWSKLHRIIHQLQQRVQKCAYYDWRSLAGNCNKVRLVQTLYTRRQILFIALLQRNLFCSWHWKGIWCRSKRWPSFYINCFRIIRLHPDYLDNKSFIVAVNGALSAAKITDELI